MINLEGLSWIGRRLEPYPAVIAWKERGVAEKGFGPAFSVLIVDAKTVASVLISG